MTLSKQMTKAIFVFIALFLSTILFLLKVFADENIQVISEQLTVEGESSAQKIVLVRGDGAYPPFEMMEEGQLAGLHLDIIKYAAEQLNIIVEVHSLPWKRAIKLFSEGQVDAISYFGFTEERARFSYFNDGNILSQAHKVLLVLDERKDEFEIDKNLSFLGNAVVGVQLGYSYGRHFDEMTHINKDEVVSEADVELMLNKRRHDLAIMNYQQFQGYKQRGGFHNIVALEAAFDTVAQYIAFSRTGDLDQRRKRLTEAFSTEIKRLKRSPGYDEMLRKYDFYR